MCSASQADVLVPQGYGSILAQIIIIIKPHRSKGFIKQNVSWAFGSSCQMEWESHIQFCWQTNSFCPATSSEVSGSWQGLWWCLHACVQTRMQRQLAQAHFSFPAYFIDVISDTQCSRPQRGIQTEKHIWPKGEQVAGENSLRGDLPLCSATFQHTSWHSRNADF